MSISRSSANDFRACSGVSRSSRSASSHASGHKGPVCRSNLAGIFPVGIQSNTDLRLFDDILAFSIVFSSSLPLMFQKNGCSSRRCFVRKSSSSSSCSKADIEQIKTRPQKKTLERLIIIDISYYYYYFKTKLKLLFSKSSVFNFNIRYLSTML